MGNGQGGLTVNEWISRIERRLENLEKESAQKLSTHDKEDSEMFKTLWAEINTMKLQNTRLMVQFGLVAALGSAILMAGVEAFFRYVLK